MTEPTKNEIADVFNSLMSTAHSYEGIYGTPTKIIDKVIRHWVQNSKDLVTVTEQLADAQKILAQCLYELPCSYIPNHTVENIPTLIADQVQRGAEEYRRAESLEQRCEKLVGTLRRVMKWMDESGYYDVSPYHQAVEALAVVKKQSDTDVLLTCNYEDVEYLDEEENSDTRFTVEEIASYISGWAMGPFDSVREIGKATLLNALSQLECDQDGIAAVIRRKKG